MSLPHINEVGRLWRDPELKYLPSGKAVCDLGIVFTDRRKNDAGVWEDAGSMFVRATVWETMAENCANTFSKGDNVIVSGKLSVREYERKDGAGKGQSIELKVFEIGPSLRWSEAKIQRIQRRSDDTSGGSDDPWSNPGKAVDDSEPPF